MADKPFGATSGQAVAAMVVGGQISGIDRDIAELGCNIFTLRTAEQIKAEPEQPYLVRTLLPARGVAAIFGESGSGKSFLAMDLVFAIATGRASWFGLKVKQSPVVYVALEGQGGLNRRIRAWEAHHGHEGAVKANWPVGQGPASGGR